MGLNKTGHVAVCILRWLTAEMPDLWKPAAQVNICHQACAPASLSHNLGNSGALSDLEKVSFLHSGAPIPWMVGKQQGMVPEGLQYEWLPSLLSVPCLSLNLFSVTLDF